MMRDAIAASSVTDRIVAIFGNSTAWVMASISTQMVEHGPAWVTALGGLFAAICTGVYFLAKTKHLSKRDDD